MLFTFSNANMLSIDVFLVIAKSRHNWREHRHDKRYDERSLRRVEDDGADDYVDIRHNDAQHALYDGASKPPLPLVAS